MKGTRIKCELPLASIIGHAVIWILLTVVTLGIGLFDLAPEFRIP